MVNDMLKPGHRKRRKNPVRQMSAQVFGNTVGVVVFSLRLLGAQTPTASQHRYTKIHSLPCNVLCRASMIQNHSDDDMPFTRRMIR